MTAALEGGEWSAAHPGSTLPNFTGGWVGPWAILDGRKISSPQGFDPGPSSPRSVSIPTELPDPRATSYNIENVYVLSTQCIFVFRVDLNTNSGYVLIH